MRDLFVRHPTDSNLWKWSARADDTIVFLTGFKTNPISTEHHILSKNPEISGLLVAGSQRLQASLLIQSVSELVTLEEKTEFIEKIWPSVEEANQLCPVYAKIAKSHILFTTASKPMLLAAKGTIQRAPTLDLYKAELDKLYEDADKLSASGTGKEPAVSLNIENLESISMHIRQLLRHITKWSMFDDNEDFFVLGMDLLQVMALVHVLREEFSLPSISKDSVYTNPSIAALSKAVVRLSEAQNSTKE